MNILKANFCILFSLFFSFKGTSQAIFLKEYNIYLNPQKCIDTITRSIDKNKTMKIFLLECKGRMDVEVYSLNKLVEKGSYVNSLDTLKSYSLVNPMPSRKKKIIVKQFFQPLRDGVWLFYDERYKKNKIINYSEGVEIVNSEIKN